MSFRAAIDAKCKECIYDPIGGKGTWRQQTEACTSYSCPLYQLRPTSASTKVDSGPDLAPERRLPPEIGSDPLPTSGVVASVRAEGAE